MLRSIVNAFHVYSSQCNPNNYMKQSQKSETDTLLEAKPCWQSLFHSLAGKSSVFEDLVFQDGLHKCGNLEENNSYKKPKATSCLYREPGWQPILQLYFLFKEIIDLIYHNNFNHRYRFLYPFSGMDCCLWQGRAGAAYSMTRTVLGFGFGLNFLTLRILHWNSPGCYAQYLP